ncbi:GNAT superfamily N-acetyltransferase [Deinococcus sp. HSC-46F16]|uniref:GNAT family N-acetyltransferase n=1 Tax=Deinococcus sp. HSC-46F16 TaxID=2910968 RepID=UPI00209D3240|nr:GNAT family N-acetyltransferase [Deinococcus sp. HSC-46F16]MCP2014092.1 GNAT superfamily N-acetyltransferase [Deinococcus sp. HSC-46F16]
MPVTVTPAQPLELLPQFATLYGASEDDFRPVAARLAGAWAARDGAGKLVGALGLRPSPHHGTELMGGAMPGPEQGEAATALARIALEAVGRTYAFAEPHLFPAHALEAVGYRVAGFYRLLCGPTPSGSAQTPDGLRLLPLAAVPDLSTRMAGLATYQDRIGHHTPAPEHAKDGAGGSDPALSLIALDADGRAAGLCVAGVSGDQAHIGSPGVRPDLRATGLRRALLLGVCALARERGLERIRVESWGDTPQELADDLALGLEVEEETAIYAAG